MEKQNLTLSLPKEIIKRAKIQAAKEDKSLTRFAQEALEEKLKAISGYRSARSRHLGILATPRDLGSKGKIDIAREKLHERR